jgi:hypothetical protein
MTYYAGGGDIAFVFAEKQMSRIKRLEPVSLITSNPVTFKKFLLKLIFFRVALSKNIQLVN